MNAKRKIRRALVTMLSVALLAACTVMPAMAAYVSTDLNGGKVTFTTTLDMSGATGASAPDATFTYTITPGDAVSATADIPAINAGIEGATIADVKVNPSDTGATISKPVTVDFDNVTFNAPGIYRYKITATTADPDIAHASGDNGIRYLDVYVTNKNDGGLEISNYFLLTTAAGLIVDNDGKVVYATGSVKSDNIAFDYTTYSLSLDKVVTGLMGDKDANFDFTITFTGTPGEFFTYNDQKIVLDEEGTQSVDISLKDSTPKAEITGIPSNVKYTVTENIAKTEGYTTTATVNGSQVTVTPDDNTQTLAEQTMGMKNNDVVVTNDRGTGNYPATGVILNVAPYALMVVIAAAGAFVFLRKRAED